MVQRSTIDAIRDRVDLVDVVSQTVTLKRKGNTWLGLCPFHQEKTPSFNVVPHKGIYHCFGCGEGGDVFRFVMKTRGLSFMEAVREVGAICGVEVEERQLSPEEQRRQKAIGSLSEVLELAASWFQSVLSTRPEGAEARAYLDKRGIKRETIDRFRLGYAPDSWDALLEHLHRQGVTPEQAVAAGLARPRERGRGAYAFFRGRVMVPILDQRGRVVAFGGRVLQGDGPKYVNSAESEIYQKSKTLFALSVARNAIQRKGRVLVVEGYFDVMSLHQAGFEEAVATCGTALTVEHLGILSRLAPRAVALFDSDAAGIRAAVRSLEMFLAAGVEPLRLELGDAKDPDEYLLRYGAERFEALVEHSEPLLNLLVRDAAERHGGTPMGQQRAIDEIAPVLRYFPQGTALGTRSVEKVASAFGVKEFVVREAMSRAERPAAQPAAQAPAAPRWTGTRELNHLLWLLIHLPEEARPIFAELDPDPEAVSDRTSVLKAVVLLSQGASLPDVLEQVSDADLARVLRQAAAREGLYTPGQGAGATRQILVGMELRRLEDALARVGREIDACAPGTGGSYFSDLFLQRQELQRKRKNYLAIHAGRAGRVT